MKFSQILVCLAIGVSGCQSMPLHEYDYSGELPTSVEANFAVADQFASDLAAETNLKVTFRDQTSLGGHNPTGIVDLSATNGETISGKGKISVHIATYTSPHCLYVVIYGDIDAPEAKEIAKKAEELFASKYPNSKLIPFTRYQGILGP
jgi:hypothetical protein